MARKKKTNPNKKIISFVITFLMMATGVYYYGLNYVPQKWYEEQTMMPNQQEAYYVNQWCTSDFGRKEAVLWDMTRVDCLAKDYAIEFDFAHKWAESIGQALYYAEVLQKEAGIVLIVENLLNASDCTWDFLFSGSKNLIRTPFFLSPLLFNMVFIA